MAPGSLLGPRPIEFSLTNSRLDVVLIFSLHFNLVNNCPGPFGTTSTLGGSQDKSTMHRRGSQTSVNWKLVSEDRTGSSPDHLLCLVGPLWLNRTLHPLLTPHCTYLGLWSEDPVKRFLQCFLIPWCENLVSFFSLPFPDPSEITSGQYPVLWNRCNWEN